MNAHRAHIMPDHYLTFRSRQTAWQRFALALLALFGWRVNFVPLPGPHGVVIVYPHTSNWDFVIGLIAKWALGIPFRWLGKEALFRGICGMLLGPFLRSWGGVPTERGTATGAIQRLADDMKASKHYWLALAPEGTRRYRDTWRSGFYHIAVTAGVPLGIACIDYGRKEVRLVDYLKLSGDLDADLECIREAYSTCRGLRHEFASPIALAKRDERRK